MHNFRNQHFLTALGGSALLSILLLALLTLSTTAQDQTSTQVEKPSQPSRTTASQNFQLLGSYSGSNGFVGEAINASGNRAYASFDSGLQVLDISNPSAVQHLGGRATPQGSVAVVKRDGGLLYMAVDRPSGLGGDYLEILSSEPTTRPTLLGTYTPPSVNGFAVTSLHDMAFNSSDPELYVAQSNGVTVLDRFSGSDVEGKIPLLGRYTTDVVRNVLVTENVLVADTVSGVELLTLGSSPSRLGRLTTTGPANAIALVGNTLYRATGLGLEVIDVTNLTNPQFLRTIPELHKIANVRSRGSLLYTTQYAAGGVRAYFAADPLNLSQVGYYQDDDFSAVGLTLWDRIYATGNLDGMRILQYTGETPRLQVQATGAGTAVNGTPWGVGQTDTFTQPFTIRLAQSIARLDLQGKCEGVLRILMALESVSSVPFDPFEVFVEVLDMSPTLCEPNRPQPVTRQTTAQSSEARVGLRMASGALQVGVGDISILRSVRTPVAMASSRGQSSFTIIHNASSDQTTVRALLGAVTVVPESETLAPVTLLAGQEVEVRPDQISLVRQVGGLFLPAVLR